MLLLWVVGIDLAACFAGFLHHQVVRLAFDDPLNFRFLVSGHEDEAGTLAGHALIGGRCELDRVEAGRLSAFTVKRKRRLDTVLGGALIDLFVDAAEDLFVSGRPLGEVHRAILSHGPSRVQVCISPHV